nr:YbhB/YbcL family Raf kinase inhibitor-like protein [Propionibacterium sp.]
MNLERSIPPHPHEHLPAAPASLRVTSEDFVDGQPLPRSAGLRFGNISPQLSWSGAPAATRSFLLLCHDPDAPVIGGFHHWAVAGIPADVTSLERGAGTRGRPIADGAAVTLVNDYGTRDFGGCAPPRGDRPHRYVFTVLALDTDEPVDPATSIAAAQFGALAHVLARGSITGLFAQ